MKVYGTRLSVLIMDKLISEIRVTLGNIVLS